MQLTICNESTSEGAFLKKHEAKIYSSMNDEQFILQNILKMAWYIPSNFFVKYCEYSALKTKVVGFKMYSKGIAS